MKRKIKFGLYLVGVPLLLTVGTLAFLNRPYRRVVFEMIVMPVGQMRFEQFERHILRENRTLISYSTRGINRFDDENPILLLLPFNRRRTRITLSDEEFFSLKEGARKVSYTSETDISRSLSLMRATLIYNGNVYTQQTWDMSRLEGGINRLSPLMAHLRGE